MKRITFTVVSAVLALALASIFLLNGCAKKEKIVAEIGDRVITGEEFKEAFIKRYRTEEAAQKQSFRERQDFLTKLTEEELKLKYAYDLELDKQAEVVAMVEEARKRFAVQNKLYEIEIINKNITPQDVREFYERKGEEINARHILIKTDAGDTTGVSDSTALAKADSLYRVIKDGGDWDMLAKEFSDDKSNSEKGGDLGYFTWGKMVPEFQEVAFALKKGEMSKPVKTPYGYHLIQLVDKRKVEQQPFAEVEKQIKKEIQQSMFQELRDQANDYLENIKVEMNLVTFDDRLDSIYEKIEKDDSPKNISLFSSFTEDERKMVVAEWDKGEVTVTDLDTTIKGMGERIESGEDFIEVIDGIILPLMLTDRAKECGAFDDPETEKVGLEVQERQMLQLIAKQEIEDKISYDDSSLKEYYEASLDKYMEEPQVTIREIFIDDKDLAEKLLKRAKAGENFKKLAKKYNTRKKTLKDAGKLGPFKKRQYGAIGRESFKLEAGELCKIPVRTGKNYSVFKVMEKIPKRQKTFSEVKSSIEMDYKRDTKKQLEEEWVERLRKEIPIVYHEDALRNCMPFATVAKAPSKKDETKKEGGDKKLQNAGKKPPKKSEEGK